MTAQENESGKESKMSNKAVKLDRIQLALLVCIGVLFWVVIMSFALTVQPVINGFYAITAGTMLTIGVVATLPKRSE